MNLILDRYCDMLTGIDVGVVYVTTSRTSVSMQQNYNAPELWSGLHDCDDK